MSYIINHFNSNKICLSFGYNAFHFIWYPYIFEYIAVNCESPAKDNKA